MDKSDLTKLVQLVACLCESFGRTPSKVTYLAYEIGLSDLSIEAITKAVERALRESRFMPSAAELRELAGEATKEDRAVLAWTALLKHIHLGPYKHVDFDDPFTNATIRSLGGWPTFLSRFSGADAEKWLRKEFIDTYRAFHRSGITGEAAKPLPGLSGGSYGDGTNYEPPIVRITTGLPSVPMLQVNEPITITKTKLPKIELKKP